MRAHARGIKVFFDIITNHTADVIAYDESLYNAEGNLPYVDKATEPYRTAMGLPFDDRDSADGDPAFPAVNLRLVPLHAARPRRRRGRQGPRLAQ